MNRVHELKPTTHLASWEHSVEEAGEQGVVLCHELRYHRVARRPIQTKATTTMVTSNHGDSWSREGMLHMGKQSPYDGAISIG